MARSETKQRRDGDLDDEPDTVTAPAPTDAAPPAAPARSAEDVRAAKLADRYGRTVRR